MPFPIDLHLHSSASPDADLPVPELLERCISQEICTLAITDHNSVRAVEEARAYGAARGLTVIPGIEIHCLFDDRNFHLLGYGFGGDFADFLALEQRIGALQSAAVTPKLDRLAALGLRVDPAELRQRAGDSVWPEELMAEVLLEDEHYRTHPLLAPYRAGGARSDGPLINFYWDYFASGKPCHVPVRYPELAAMVEIIRSNGGSPVLAHPGANLKPLDPGVLDSMRRAGVAGLEVFSSYHSPAVCADLFDYTHQHGMQVTCGSDFHGHNKPGIEPGSVLPDPAGAMRVQSFLAALNGD